MNTGDFNTKVGCRTENESCVGPFGYRTRNEKGGHPADYALRVHYEHFPPQLCPQWSPESQKRERNQERFLVVPKNF